MRNFYCENFIFILAYIYLRLDDGVCRRHDSSFKIAQFEYVSAILARKNVDGNTKIKMCHDHKMAALFAGLTTWLALRNGRSSTGDNDDDGLTLNLNGFHCSAVRVVPPPPISRYFQ